MKNLYFSMKTLLLTYILTPYRLKELGLVKRKEKHIIRIENSNTIRYMFYLFDSRKKIELTDIYLIYLWIHF